ncbi:hypothetical protein DJ568_14100 [Mucilaginibacter hurinus]|uniref:Uncharacterized protein n=1 Tax=Mucilaginibacter hurinus TaxID=2201324 RepID=A0A367GMB5_9SPHI|nr:hypothetical protein [Mucilaginibacter hurinus]RCH54016.1 hypothetical protein DJ568_14100 [Mucilaginibacter hurinus]
MNFDDDFELDSEGPPQEPFHIEVDLYDTGDYSNVLVVPCNETYVIVANNQHLCTLVKTCDEPECWEQQDGTLDEEIVEKIGSTISGYTGGF